MQNLGLLEEDKFVYFLNNKLPKDLPENINKFLEVCFGIVDPNLPVTVTKPDKFIKPDMLVTHNNTTVGVSLKTGSSIHVHEEKLVTFLEFLREYKISERTIETLLLFFYGDGTKDGSGKDVRGSEDVYSWLKDRIHEANIEFNSDKAFIVAFTERCVFQGVNPDAVAADVIVDGNFQTCVSCNRNQFYSYLLGKLDHYMTYNALHIGPFILRPHFRLKPGRDRIPTHIYVHLPHLDNEVRFIGRYYTSYLTEWQKRKILDSEDLYLRYKICGRNGEILKNYEKF